VPAEDAAPVARLRDAGAVIFGKTNLPLYAGDCQSFNDVFGTTNNPFDLARSCGGSSGGAAAALACGLTPLELGSDIGGSIRGPAHVNGVVGHKSSYGIVPAHGQIPGPPGTLSQADLAVAGPMARTVEDCELALDLLAGPDRWNHPAWRLALPAPRPRSLDDYRIGVWADDPACPVGRDVRALVEHAATELEDAGAVVDTDVRPAISFESAAATFDALLAAALSGGYPKASFERMAASGGDDDDVSRTRRLTAMRHREWLSHNERRLQHRQRWAELFGHWDAMLLPVMPVPAIAHDHRVPMAARSIDVDGQERPYLDLMRWVGIVGVAYLPATVVPVGLTAAGLPVGVQVVGAYLHDRTTLDLARHLLELIGGCPRPPGC
jgi:amidase